MNQQGNNNFQIPQRLEVCSFVKLLPKSKKPFESEWQKKPYSFSEITEWVKQGNNYGVAGGYGGLVIIDQDKVELREAVEKKLPQTFTVKSREDRRHSYYLCPEITEKIVLRTGPRKEDHYGEIISFGSQVVGPGSIHPETNMPYEVVNDVALATVSREGVFSALADYLPVDVFGKRNKDYEIERGNDLNVIDVLEKFGIPLNQTGKQLQISHPIHGSENGGNFVANPEKNVWHCFRCQSGGGAINLIAVLERIIDCNQATQGGLRGEDFKKTMEIAQERYGLNMGNDWLKSKIQTETQQQVPFTQLGDLLSEPDEEIPWVVEGLLPAGGFSGLFSKPKVGKSTLARQLALSVARGEPFLGMQTNKGRVLYVALEEKRSEAKNHFKLMSANNDDDIGVFTGSAPKDTNAWLISEIRRKQPILVIVDTLFRFCRVSDVNDYAKITTALDPLLALAREHNTHLMVLHHARKSAADGADGILGSTAIFGSVDTAITLKRTDIRRTMETEQRYGKNMEPTVLTFDDKTRITSLGISKEEDDVEKIKGEVIEFLKSISDPVEESVINDQVSGRTTLKRQALRQLVSNNKVARAGAGKKGNPFLYSCFLVPSIYAEQGNKELTNIENKIS